jgi:hypothetical protein
MRKKARLASAYTAIRGAITLPCGHSAIARPMGIALRTPNGRASYDAAHTTPRFDGQPTITGCPRSDGSSRCSTEA